MTDTEHDSSVTNDKDAGKGDTGLIDGNPVDSVPFASNVTGIVKSGQKIAEDPEGNWNEAVSIGGQVYGMASTIQDIANDPLNWLITQGLGFLIDWIQPLQDAIGYVTGNPERMDEEMAKWGRVQNALVPLSEQIRDAANAGLMVWEGKASDAAKERLNDFADGVGGIANDVNLIHMIMNISKMLMELAYKFVLSLIAELIEWMIMVWIPALAAAPVTFGGSTAVAATQTAYQTTTTVSKATQFIRKVNMILTKLKVLLRKLSKNGMNKAGNRFRSGPGQGSMQNGNYMGALQTMKKFVSDPKNIFDPTKLSSYPGQIPGAVTTGKEAGEYGVGAQSDEEIDKKLSGD